MTSSQIFKMAHKITKSIRTISSEIDYRAQFGAIVKQLYVSIKTSKTAA